MKCCRTSEVHVLEIFKDISHEVRFFDCLTLEVGSDWLSPDVCNKLMDWPHYEYKQTYGPLNCDLISNKRVW